MRRSIRRGKKKNPPVRRGRGQTTRINLQFAPVITGREREKPLKIVHCTATGSSIGISSCARAKGTRWSR